MKILCVSPGYFPAFRFGGPVASVHGLNKALVKKGIDVTVYATNAGLRNDVLVDQEVDVEGVRVTYFSFAKLLEFTGTTGWQFSLKMTKALKSELKKFDLVHIHAVWNYPTAVATYYCMKYDIPYIIAPRGTLYPETIRKYYWKKLPYYYLLAKRFMESAAAIHYTTHDELEKCHKSLGFKNKAMVIPNGIDVSEYNNLPGRDVLEERYPVLKGKKVILFLGRLNWKKGLDILIKAYSKLTESRDDLHLLIVGNDNGGYKKRVMSWINGCGIDHKVTFTGMLKGSDKLAVLAGSDIFVLPSYSENFGMAVVEAMASGLPVVISNKVGIYREVEKHKAGVVVECEPESLYRGIKYVLGDENFAKELSINGRRLAENYYGINKVADMMIDAYGRTLR